MSPSQGEEEILKEGLTPLLDTLKSKESQREAEPLLKYHFPLPLLREGGQGDRLLNELRNKDCEK